MNKTKLLIFCCIALLIANIALLIFVFGVAHPPRPNNDDRNRHIIIEELDFSDTQIQQYDSIILLHVEKSRALTESINLNRQNLYEYLNQEDNKRGSDSIIEIIGQQQAKIEDLNFDHFLAIKSICKPEQIQDFEKLSHQLSELFDKKPKGRMPNEGRPK